MVASLTRLSLVLCPLVAAALTVGVRPAGASVVSVQVGSLTTGGSGSVPPTLSSGSTSGTLLVAVVANSSSTSAPFSASANWVRATSLFYSADGDVEIWYYVNNPGGITSATFTAGSGSSGIVGQLSEWNGIVSSSPVDKTGTKNQGSASSVTVQTSAVTTVVNDLAITGFNVSGTSVTSM